MKILRKLILISLMLGACACGAQTEGLADWGTFFDIRIGEEATISTQLALTSQEQLTGLMHREALGVNSGMLFIYRKPSRMGFWMKNTTIPLDIGFFNAKGVLREIHPLDPLNLNIVESASIQIQFALEVNSGWFKANNVHLGAKLKIKDVKSALKARGYPASILNRPDRAEW